jgi:hypothetical protein
VRSLKLRGVGRYKGGQKPWEKGDSRGRRLDPGQYPELNAMFYNADPAEFIKMRIESLSLMACTDEQISPAFGADRSITTQRPDDDAPEVAATFGAMDPPDEAARKRYLRMESVMIAHHASEALLRLFFAHVEHEECPWLGMSASTDFREFKKQVGAALKQGFDRAQIAAIFLGGDSPKDACIQLSNNEFEDAIAAIDLLLVDAASRVTDDSFVYNAVKHGITAIAIDDDEAEVAFRSDDGQHTTLHKGPMHVYLHKTAFPNAPKGETEWFYSADDSNPTRELSVSTLISKAIDSLWAVARRRYLGATSSIIYIPKAEVETAIYATTMVAMNKLARMTSELIKLKPDGTVDETTHRARMYGIPDPGSLEALFSGPQPKSRKVVLPARQRDRQVYTTSRRAYMPLTPRGFQRG